MSRMGRQVPEAMFTGPVMSLSIRAANAPATSRTAEPSGDMKARWYGRPINMSEARGTMEDYSQEHTEVRPYWRDMRFDKRGVLMRAWNSDQRDLADSEAP